MRFLLITHSSGPPSLGLARGGRVHELSDGEEIDFIYPEWGRAVVSQFGSQYEITFAVATPSGQRVFTGSDAIEGGWKAEPAAEAHDGGDAAAALGDREPMIRCRACDGLGKLADFRTPGNDCPTCAGAGWLTKTQVANLPQRFEQLVAAGT